MSTDEQNERLETLELKLMDLENTVQELNDVVLRQFRDIERLQLQQEELLNHTPDNVSPANAGHETPPHY